MLASGPPLMTRLLLSPGLALVLLAAAGPRALAQPPPSTAAPALDAASRAALAFLPFDTALFASIDVAEARRSPMGRRVLARLERDRTFLRVTAELRRRVGFDYRRDIERVWLAMPPGAFDGGEQVAFIARLTIDQARFVEWLRRARGDQLAARQVGSTTYYAAGDIAWAFLDRETMLVAHASYVEEVLRATSGRRHTADANRPLMLAVAEAGRPGAHAWLAVLLPEQVRTRLRQGALTSTLADVRWTAGRLTLGDVTRWRGQVKTSRRESAQALVAVLRQMLDTAAASHALVEAGLSAAVRQTAVAARGDAVELEGSLPGARAGAVVDAVLAP
jgi:hypothetical protein